MHILHLNQRNQRYQILFQYLRDKKKRKKEGGSEKGGGGGVKIHLFHLPWICACSGTQTMRLADHNTFSLLKQFVSKETALPLRWQSETREH